MDSQHLNFIVNLLVCLKTIELSNRIRLRLLAANFIKIIIVKILFQKLKLIIEIQIYPLLDISNLPY